MLSIEYLPQFPRDRSVGIGCIGAGFIMADCHLLAYQKAGFRPVAIMSRQATRAAEVAARYQIPRVYHSVDELLNDPEVQVVDVATPPDIQFDLICRIANHSRKVRGILAQKPLGTEYRKAAELVRRCDDAGIVLAVNQNMRYDQSVRGCKSLLAQGSLGEPVLATIDMRAIPHWMSWQERQGWVTLRIMSIHHLDTFRYWFGEPERVYASVRPDPRTARKFAHQDGICLYIVEFSSGARAAAWDDVWAGPAREGAAADIGIRWRVEGTLGMARGEIGWPRYPAPSPSTLDYTTVELGDAWQSPRWTEQWFPDAFAGTMAQLLCAIEDGREPEISGRDNLQTMALVDACYRSAHEHRAVEPREIASG